MQCPSDKVTRQSSFSGENTYREGRVGVAGELAAAATRRGRERKKAPRIRALLTSAASRIHRLGVEDSCNEYTIEMPETELINGGGATNPRGLEYHAQRNGLVRSKDDPSSYEQRDLIRVIIQALHDHGYHESAQYLEVESGISMESDSVQRFRQAILNGDYEPAMQMIPLSDAIRFEIRKEMYLELLESRCAKDALVTLRNEVTPLAPDLDTVQKLAALMMANSAQDVRVRAQWTGAGPEARRALLGRIQRLMPGVMLPMRRLDHLLEQAFKFQEQNCFSHYRGAIFDGIVLDHQCQEAELRLYLAERLQGHTNEVWHASISHDGNVLATASKDGSVIIWSLPTGELLRKLSDHTAGVMHVTWSPDDQFLLTCSLDSSARLWRADTGECQRVFLMNGEATSGLWTEGGQSVVVASEDGFMTKFSCNGSASMKKALRAIDMASVDDDRLAMLDTSRNVRILRSDDFGEITRFTEVTSISSLTVSRNGEDFLLNATDEKQAEINLWRPCLPGSRYDVEASYYGHTNRKFLIRSCFAHPTEVLIATGCEMGNIFLYHRTNAHILQKIPAHSGPVSCVSWTDAHGGILVSVSDDRTVALWRPQQNILT